MVSMSTCTQIVNDLEKYGEKGEKPFFVEHLFQPSSPPRSPWRSSVEQRLDPPRRFLSKVSSSGSAPTWKTSLPGCLQNRPSFFLSEIGTNGQSGPNYLITSYAHLVFTFFVQVLHVLNQLLEKLLARDTDKNVLGVRLECK